MLTVAAGLTFNDHLEVAGASMITVALTVWAGVVVRWIHDELEGPARMLLGIATIAWILPMALALGWALGPFLPEPIVTTFATMLRFHAALQTFGLVLCGLAGIILTEATDAGPPIFNQLTNNTTLEAHDDVAHHTHA